MNSFLAFLKPVGIGALAFVAGMIIYDLYKDYRSKQAIGKASGPVTT